MQWLEQINIMHTYDFYVDYFGIVFKLEDEAKMFCYEAPHKLMTFVRFCKVKWTIVSTETRPPCGR
jgi:hypothetical protein